MKIIDGKKIAEKIKDDIAKNVFEIVQKEQRRPALAIILAGGREDSKLYVSLKEKSAKEVGIDTSLYLIDENDSEKNIIDIIKFLNQDETVDGILVQLPLPKKFDTEKILPIINPLKDVDGFNVSEKKIFLSPVLMAIKYSLEKSKMRVENKKAFLFYNSEIFAQEVGAFLKELQVDFTRLAQKDLNIMLESNDGLKEIQKKTQTSDIIISAMGKPEFIGKNFLRNGQVLIDIGISKKDNKVYGDIKFSETAELEGFVTPVPGGVGPMTVACLLKNVLQAYLSKERRNLN